MTYTKKPGGFKSLAVYWLAKEIYYLNYIFCEKYIHPTSRTFGQTCPQSLRSSAGRRVVQAARSGKQNIVEGSLENSIESNLKLSGVSRASYGELIEDYEDFLWLKELDVWDKNDSKVLAIRRKLINTNESHVTHKSHQAYGVAFSDAESFANLMITLCAKEGYLLDQFLKGIEGRFVKEGGFRENLFKKRLNYKKSTGSF
ncbi:MAG: four helix bundle suffix domain-containing protein [Patescibacteria group bacterium]